MGQINIGGTKAVQLKGYTDSSITTDQAFTFPDGGGEIFVTPGTKKIEVAAPDDAWGSNEKGETLFELKRGDDPIFTIRSSTSASEKYKNNCVIDQGPYYDGDKETTAGGSWAFYYLYQRLQGEYNAPQNVNGFALLYGDKIGWAVSYNGTTGFSNIFINLEPENDDHYVSTTLEDGQAARIYAGPKLDIKQKVFDFQSKIETLEAAKASLEARITALEGGAS